MKLFNDFEYINLFNSKRTRIAEMSLIFKCLFIACQTLPLNSSPGELQEEVGVTDKFLKDEMSVKMDQNDNDDKLSSITIIHLHKSMAKNRLEMLTGRTRCQCLFI